jgi:hypothetical protein
MESFLPRACEGYGRCNSVIGHVFEEDILARARREIVNGPKGLVRNAVPFKSGMKCQDGVGTKRGWDAVAAERNRCQSSRIDSLDELANAALSLADFTERKQGRRLGKLSKGYVSLHEILTQTVKSILIVCLSDSI